jgi:uncharacterized membrane protein YeaQ/YmgE (transglycosylase-associated protein family)
MRCFNHRDNEAVGVCKACSRGLCADCAVESDSGLACRDHEAEAAAMTALIRSNVAANLVTPLHYLWLGTLIVGTVGCLAAMALVRWAESAEQAVAYLFFIPAVLFGAQAGALAQWILARRSKPAG